MRELIGTPFDGENTIKLDEAASELPPKLTREQIGKVHRQYFTAQHSKVAACGHKYEEARPPRTNCEDCWLAWFNLHGELVQALDEAFTKEGPAVIIQLKGKKFFRQFLRFMSTVANLKKESDEQGS